MVIGLVAAALSAVVFGLAAVLQGHAVRRLPTPDAGMSRVLRLALRSPLMITVVAMYLVGWLLHAISIDKLPLFLAQSGVAASLVITALGAAVWLREKVQLRQWVGILAVAGGLGLLMGGAGKVKTAPFNASGLTVLYAALVVIGMLAVWLLRREGHGVAIAVLGGLAYAGSPLATRAFVDDADLGRLISGATIPIYGVLGFWLYSVAMQQISVAAATTVLVCAQVVVPAAIGVFVLGDGLDPRWGWLVAPGLVLTVVGALVVEKRTDHDPDWMSP